MKMTFLEPEEDIRASRHRVANQHRDKLSVLKGNVWTPISYDVLDYIACDHVASHRAIVTDDEHDNGYTIEECEYYTTLSGAPLEHDTDKMEFLEPEENLEFERVSAINQYKDHLSVFKGNKWVPISFDSLEYISCGSVCTEDAVVTADPDRKVPDTGDCSYFTILTSSGGGEADDAGAARLLEPEEKPDVFWHSSISQHKNTLSVMQRGEWVPIQYDVLDYIACEGVACHPAIVTDGDDIGYDFDVAEQTFFTDKYIYHDETGVELRQLPHWFGEGMYEAYYHNSSFINSDESALGERIKKTRRVGLSYALAEKTLEADE